MSHLHFNENLFIQENIYKNIIRYCYNLLSMLHKKNKREHRDILI